MEYQALTQQERVRGLDLLDSAIRYLRWRGNRTFSPTTNLQSAAYRETLPGIRLLLQASERVGAAPSMESLRRRAAMEIAGEIPSAGAMRLYSHAKKSRKYKPSTRTVLPFVLRAAAMLLFVISLAGHIQGQDLTTMTNKNGQRRILPLFPFEQIQSDTLQVLGQQGSGVSPACFDAAGNVVRGSCGGGSSIVLPANASGLATDASGNPRAQLLADIQAITGNPKVGVDPTNSIATAQSAANSAQSTANAAQSTANAALGQANAAAVGGFSLVDQSHMLALYNFKETSGTVLTDGSGNGNNGTIITAPVMNGIGYQFTVDNQEVDLPTALNSSNTYYFAVSFKSGQIGQLGGDNNDVTCFLCNSGAYSNAQRLEFNSAPAATGPFANTGVGMTGVYSMQVISGATNVAANKSTVPDVFADFHVLAVSCPASQTPGFYLDGQPLAISVAGSSCNNAMNGVTSSAFRFGNDATGYFATNLTYYEAAFFSSVHTAAQVAANSSALRQAVINKGGIRSANQPYLYTVPSGIILGDSIPCGYGLTGDSPGCGVGTVSSKAAVNLVKNYLNNTNVTIFPYVVPASPVETNLVVVPQSVVPLCNAGTGRSWVIQEGGSNSFQQSPTALTSAQITVSTFGKVSSVSSQVAASGNCDAFLQTLLSQGGNYPGSGGGTLDAAHQYDSEYRRQNWRTTKYSGIIDLGTDPYLGATNAYTNPMKTGTCDTSTIIVGCAFQADTLHLAPWGHQRLAQAWATGLNGFYGSNDGNMNPTVITTTSYGALAVADGGRFFNPDANGATQTATVFSAMWLTGRRLRYCNVATTNNLVLASPSDAGFSNGTPGNTITVAPGTCAKLEGTFNENPASPAGFWRPF